MKYVARVEVKFKEGLFDPESEATKKSLQQLEFSVDNVRLSKVFRITIDANSEDDAKVIADEMCKKLLANPNKDDYSIEIEEVK